MKVQINQRRGNGDVVSILIEPFGPNTRLAGVHQVVCTRTYVSENNSKQVSTFYLDNEAEVWDLLFEIQQIRSGFIGSNPRILEAWHKNNLDEVLA